MNVGNYESGADLLLLNTIYHKADRKKGIKDDQIDLIYRDNKTGKKYVEEIKNPDYKFYMCKKDIKPSYNMLSIDRDSVDEYTVKYKNLTKELYDLCGETDFFFECLRTGNYKSLNRIHLDTRLFGTDVNINDHYRMRFNETYTCSNTKADVGFFDIETDAIKYIGETIDKEGNSPVSLITYISNSTNSVFTFILRNPNHPSEKIYEEKDYSKVPLRKKPGQLLNKIYSDNVKKFENKISKLTKSQINNYIKNFIINEGVRGIDNYNKFNLTNLEYNLLFYDDENELISDFFYFVKKLEPDIMEAWNIGFDITYLIERCKKRNLNILDVICSDEFNKKQCFYKIDTNPNHRDLGKRGDFGVISTKTIWIDQLLQFGAKRSGQKKYDKYTLDHIGECICDIHKLSYSHITHDLLELPYLDFEIYLLYNIMDTIVQKCIEETTSDADTLIAKAQMNSIRYEKAYRQTYYTETRARQEFLKNNDLILGNNVNKIFNKPKENYPGSLVANPTLVKKRGVKIFNKHTMVYNNCDDFDIKSEYPNDMRENNMSHQTMIGRLIIDNDKIFVGQNRFESHDFNNGGYFIDDMRSGNWLEFTHRWLHFPSMVELIKDINEYIKNKYNCNLNFMPKNSNRVPLFRYKYPPIFNTKNKPPIIIFKRRNK